MNILWLLLGLLSAISTPSASQQEVHTALLPLQPGAVLAFEQSPAQEQKVYMSRFDSLAGVPLYTTEDELLQRKGLPLQIAPDPWQECLEYQYADMSAGICGGTVLYVHVDPAQAGQYGLTLNGVRLDPVQNNIHDLLGSPDFVAEDGDVYLRGNAALKIYRNPATGTWEGIDLFDAYSS
ncbi:hypothetical protein [Paenibacillus tengchongensis]|uniref:hypothetical protein n=1 Tax=Paenibacillus tengchongensis TaxID=2608684 RepID=UPI00124E51E6|nr:hypothetical protein [Paenibacillus tengchongensis]